jgi:DNA-binding CsgD family transcriptional regulator
MTHDEFARVDSDSDHHEGMSAIRALGREHTSGFRDVVPALHADFAVPEDSVSRRDVFPALAAILGAVGKPWFYRLLADRLSTLLGCQRYLAMRYSQFAKPAFLVNNFIPAPVEAIYLEHLYRIDPLYSMVREGNQACVSTLGTIRDQGGNAEYCDALFRYACICDELAIMLPLFGGLVVAICFDDESAPFDAASIRLAQDLYPVIKQAHRLHLEASLPGGGYGLLDGHSTAVMVTTQDSELIYKNDTWRSLEESKLRHDIRRWISAGCIGSVINLGGSVLHGHRLGADSPVWSNGNIFFIEPRSAGLINTGLETVLSDVSRQYRLSPRERELFRMALQGCDTRAIALELGLSVGTVKNYKHRLYAKLDIRSERELPSLLIGFIGRAERAAALVG